MPRLVAIRFLGGSALALVALACGRRVAPAPLPTAAPWDSALGVASFDTAWARINATYYDTTFRGVDWRGLRDSLRPGVERARSHAEVRRAITTLFDRLGESHFVLAPAEVVRAFRRDTTQAGSVPGTVGLTVRLVDDDLLISDVEAGSPAALAGVHPGWSVESVDHLAVAPLLAARKAAASAVAMRRAGLQAVLRVQGATRVAAGDSVTVVLRDQGRRRRTVVLEAAAAPGEVVKYLALPPQVFTLTHRRIADAGGCVGVVAFNTWMLPVMPALERAMEAVGDCRGIVLDLRGNTGGVAGLLMGVSGFFVDTAVSLGTLHGRGTTLQFVVNPRRSTRRGESVRPFGGHLAIVVDAASASATELFAEGMRDIGRARVFGDTTAGEALPATLTTLPNGDLLMHVIADFRAPDGQRVEALGVIPDEVIPLRRAELLRGRDPALSAAVAWVGRPAVQAASRGTPGPAQP